MQVSIARRTDSRHLSVMVTICVILSMRSCSAGVWKWVLSE
ncbi:MAG TPA: hypothetical protein VFC82_10655 [Actinomycetaceae bacterium]|nr:hypothetical protein [Actinomycetaceae bacterium]